MGMNMNKEYKIVDSSDKLFCKCMRTEDGVVQLIGKNTTITLDELQEQIYNPKAHRSKRGKREKLAGANKEPA